MSTAPAVSPRVSIGLQRAYQRRSQHSQSGCFWTGLSSSASAVCNGWMIRSTVRKRGNEERKTIMDPVTVEAKRTFIETPSGRVSYVENGEGPVALFVHGVLLNGYLWRHQLAGLADQRRCIAVDLLAHGSSEIMPTQDVSFDAQAIMLAQFLDALDIDQVDLVGNDSGVGIA